MSTDRHAPFYCGTQRMDWKCYNCDFCTKRYDEQEREWRCDLEWLIDESYMGDGKFDAATAKRLGEPADCRVYNWRCPEFVEDAQERARVAEMIRAREAAQRAYENRNRPAPWIEEWLAKKKDAQTSLISAG
jgi:hypothetical protein